MDFFRLNLIDVGEGGVGRSLKGANEARFMHRAPRLFARCAIGISQPIRITEERSAHIGLHTVLHSGSGSSYPLVNLVSYIQVQSKD